MREWTLTYCFLDDPRHKIRYKDFPAESDRKALVIALKKLQSALRPAKLSLGAVMLTRRASDRMPDGKAYSDRLYRIKFRYNNRSLLEIKNPSVIFVEGYGPEILKELNEL